MKRISFIIVILILLNTAFAGNNKIDKAQEAKAKEWVKKQQLEFIENKGQFTTTEGKPADNVLFKTSFGSCDIYITDKGLSYVFIKFEEKEEEKESEEAREKEPKFGKEKDEEENKNILYYRLDMDLVGASITKDNIIKEEESRQGHYNYFYPHCPEGIYDVKGFGKITIKNIYKGIDWVIYTYKNNKEHPLKYDFIVHPEANYKYIKIKYLNAQSTSLLDNETKLKIETIAGNIEEGNIFSYQNKDKEINSKYIINNDNTISFSINDYDKTQDLIIDPLVWATCYGGATIDGFKSICVDSQDNIFITGYTSSINLPLLQLTGAYWQSTNIANMSTYILKFNVLGVRLWATYYSGSTGESGWSICSDIQDNIYIVGHTGSTDLPLQQLPGAYWQDFIGGIWDAYILKFNNQGVRLWATYYGGDNYDYATSIKVDNQGEIYIIGNTQSTNFPTKQLSGAYWQPNNGGSSDAFILKFNSLGVRQWATYYGGWLVEFANSLTIDNQNNIYIVGNTGSTDFPTQQLSGAYWQNTNNGSFDGYILKFNHLGVRQWATYYGGSNNEFTNSISVDSQDNIYIAGITRSTDFPILQLAGAYWQATNAGLFDNFILKFNNLGVRQWATYYGGINYDNDDTFSNFIYVDKQDNIYITGYTQAGFPTQYLQGEYWQPTITGGYGDLFILKFNSQGIRKWATYYGSTSMDFGTGIVANSQNYIYFIGEWQGNIAYTLNPGNGAYFDNSPNGTDDSYILEFAPCNLIPTSIQCNKNNICINDTSSITLTAIGGIGDTLKWYTGSSAQICIGKGTPITIPRPNQTTTYYARWESYCDTSGFVSIVINILPIAIVNQNQVICQGQTFHIGIHNYNIAGIYKDTLSYPDGCDTIFITNLTIVPLPIIDLGKDTVLCQGQSLILDVTNTNTSYLWQDFTTNPTYNVTQHGTYWVRVSVNSNCFTSDTIYITYKPNPIINLGNDTLLCYGQTLLLNASFPNATYLWQDSSTNHTYTIKPPYTPYIYWIKVTVNNCSGYDTLLITTNPNPQINLGDDTTLCYGQSLVLDAQFPNAKYHWQDGSTSSTYTATQAGTYWVKVTDTSSNCSTITSIKLECNLEPIIPNIFTPNGDGYNDYFVIKNKEYWNINLQVFNRWGVKVYEDTNYQNNWDGKDLSDGVYYYIIKVINKDNGIKREYNGSVTILR